MLMCVKMESFGVLEGMEDSSDERWRKKEEADDVRAE